MAIGVVYNAQNAILIAKRPLHKHLGGLWEFPGGKIEGNETPFAALKRELEEEINIQLCKAEPLTIIDYVYPEYAVQLHIWKVTHFIGIAEGKEGQEIKWVDKTALAHYNFPEACLPIFSLLQ